VSADELQQVLRHAEVPQPYVLVGLSLGGQIARVFAHKYSDEVAGLVLIDSTLESGTAPVAEDVFSALDTRVEAETNPSATFPPDMQAALAWARRLASQEKIPLTLRDGGKEFSTTGMTFSSPLWLETPDLRELTVAAAMEGTKVPLGDKPLFVISAGRLDARTSGSSYIDALRAHVANQASAAVLSRNSQFVVARASFHAVIFYEPQLVTSAILQVLASARTGDRLKPVR